MKRIEAVIRPNKVGDVLAALEKVGHPGLMITQIEGHGKQKGVEQQVRGKTYKTELVTKARIEIVVKDADVGLITKAIVEAVKTGKIGDGKIFVSDVADVIRIRTGETGEAGV